MEFNARLVRAGIACSVLAVFCCSSAHAQVRGSRAAYSAIVQARQRATEAAQRWRESKKLTVLKEIPKSPRDQGKCLSPSKLTNGSVGYLEYWQFHVLQVPGPNDVLLAMNNPDVPPIWLTGYSTKDLVDRDKVRLVGPVEIHGTKTYTTIAGAKKTVRLVNFVKRETVAKMEAETKAAAAKAKAEAEAAKWQMRWLASYHTWTDRTGKHSIEAIYDGYVGNGNIRLIRKDRKEIIVPLSKLKNSDRLKAVALRRAASQDK